MDGEAWWATVHGVTESDTTELLHFHFSTILMLDYMNFPAKKIHVKSWFRP